MEEIVGFLQCLQGLFVFQKVLGNKTVRLVLQIGSAVEHAVILEGTDLFPLMVLQHVVADLMEEHDGLRPFRLVGVDADRGTAAVPDNQPFQGAFSGTHGEAVYLDVKAAAECAWVYRFMDTAQVAGCLCDILVRHI